MFAQSREGVHHLLMFAVQGSSIFQGRNRTYDSRYRCDDCADFVQVRRCHFARLAAFNFWILIARTFFIIRRSVALSAELSVVLAIPEFYYSF